MSRLRLGEHSYCHATLQTYPGDDATCVTVGRYTSIAQGVVFVCGGEHRPDWISVSPLRCQLGLRGALHDGLPASRGDIVIGSDVWIGHGALVLSGVRIGDGAVVGAGAVVTRDVRAYAVVVGNPAREIRRRFPDVQVDALLRLAWWDWPDDRVAAEVEALSGADADAFLARHR